MLKSIRISSSRGYLCPRFIEFYTWSPALLVNRLCTPRLLFVGLIFTSVQTERFLLCCCVADLLFVCYIPLEGLRISHTSRLGWKKNGPWTVLPNNFLDFLAQMKKKGLFLNSFSCYSLSLQSRPLMSPDLVVGKKYCILLVVKIENIWRKSLSRLPQSLQLGWQGKENEELADPCRS